MGSDNFFRNRWLFIATCYVIKEQGTIILQTIYLAITQIPSNLQQRK